MRHRLIPQCKLLTAVLLLALPKPANAQTAAAGPYYAMPSWDQTIACTSLASCPRFIVLSNFANQAVLDRETGLVWERSPSVDLVNAISNSCGFRVVGNRQGWRLPTTAELRSLVDPTQTNPALPPGHPFTNLFFSDFPDLYWTSTPDRAICKWWAFSPRTSGVRLRQALLGLQELGAFAGADDNARLLSDLARTGRNSNQARCQVGGRQLPNRRRQLSFVSVSLAWRPSLATAQGILTSTQRRG